MSNVIPFRKPDLKKRAKAHTLCKNGYHKWKIVSERKFDVKQGRLVTLSRCIRCGQEKTTLI